MESNYEKLVKALRYCGNFAEREGCAESCEYFNDMDCPNRIMSDAAAAIEELQQIADHHEQSAKDYWKEACEYKAQLPKRGEIVRCKECIHFTQGGWCDREFDWFPVDEDDFCSMAEKMEVQDGQ